MPRPPRARSHLARALLACAALLAGTSSAPAEEAPGRIVSLNPSLTATLAELGVAERLVGIDDWSARTSPELAQLPKVGGLFNPSLESIVALEPDLVVLVPSAQQRDLVGRLEALGVDVLSLANESFEELLHSIEVLGERVGHAEAARTRAREIRTAFARNADGDDPRPRAILVIQRDPLYVAGGGSYLNELLESSGVQNVASEFDDPYPRVGVEWLIAAAPDVILDASERVGPAAAHWSRWPSLPAVEKGRVIEIEAALMTMPGPRIDDALTHMRAALAEPAE